MRMLLCAVVVAMGCGHPAPPPATPETAIENDQPEIVDAIPPVAVVMIIDRSGSMMGIKLDVAKEAARVVADALPEDALFAVLAFDSDYVTLVQMQKASHRDRIREGIEQLTAGGGTNYLPALQAAAELLGAVRAERKRLVFVSDGEAAYEGVVETVTDMAEHGVVTSTIGLDGADPVLLGDMADHGRGNLYMLAQPEEITSAALRAIE